jgi:hypothetical protein
MAQVPKLALLVLLPALLGASSCSSGGGEENTIARETFIDVLFDLRVAALGNLDQEITPAQREMILETHRVTEEDLTLFAEVRGVDPEFMEGVWAEVRSRLQDARSELGDEVPEEDVDEEIRGILDRERRGRP